jgi:hypothetical protein
VRAGASSAAARVATHKMGTVLAETAQQARAAGRAERDRAAGVADLPDGASNNCLPVSPTLFVKAWLAEVLRKRI